MKQTNHDVNEVWRHEDERAKAAQGDTGTLPANPSTVRKTTELIALQLNKEYMTMQKEPPPFIWAVPDEKNILTCAYQSLSSWSARDPARYLYLLWSSSLTVLQGTSSSYAASVSSSTLVANAI